MRSILRAAVAATALCAAVPAIADTLDLGFTGSGAPFDTRQPFLSLTPLVQTSGNFQDLGSVRFFAGNFAPRGFALADGALLPVNANTSLFAQLRNTYGGDGRTSFALPDLRGRTVVGAGGSFSLGDQVGSDTVTLSGTNLTPHGHLTDFGASSNSGDGAPYNNMMSGLALDFEITATGIFPARIDGGRGAPTQQTLAFVHMDAANDGDGLSFDLPAYRAANGAVLDINSNAALFSLMGTAYGGDGRSTFSLPETRDRVVTGLGDGPQTSPRVQGASGGNNTEILSPVELPRHTHTDPDGGVTLPAGGGQGENNLQEEVVLRWLVATSGLFPTLSTGQYDASAPFLGEMGLFAGNFAPRGWADAAGQLLPIVGNEALFSILGTQYGGDGRTSFGLPDMRGRVAVGASTGLRPGALGGSERIALGVANLPSHTHTVPAPVIPLPAAGWLLLAGLGGLAALRRRGRAA